MDEQQWRNEATLDAPDSPAPVTTVPVAASMPKKHLPWMWMWIGIGFMILASAILVVLWLRQTVNKTKTNSAVNKVKVQTVDLGSVTGNSSTINLNTADKVVINGQLQSNDGVILTPTDQPAAGVLGQIYVDKTTNQVRYYNGQTYVTLATDNGNLCNKNDTACGFATQAQVAALVAASSNSNGNVSSLQGQTGALSLLGTGGLSVSAAGNNITLALPQNLTVTSNPIFAGMTISNLTGNSIVATDSSSALQSITPAAPGLCLVSTSGLPSFSSCVSGGASVASLDGLTGALILANSSGSGSTVTIDNASTSAKGIAQFNATNFSVSSGAVNTVQDIATTSTPTFAGVLTSSLDTASAGTLTLGSTNATAISLNQNTTVSNNKNLTVSGGNVSQTGTGTFSTGTGNVTLNGATTISNGANPAANQTFTLNGTATFKPVVDSSTAFQIQNASSAPLFTADTTGTPNLITNSSFSTNATGWAFLSVPPAPGAGTYTFEQTFDDSADPGGGSLHIVNVSPITVSGPAYAVALTNGQKYTLTFKAKTASTSGTPKLTFGYYTGSDLTTRTEPANSSGAPCQTNNKVMNASWTSYSCTFTVSGGNASGIYIRTSKAAQEWYLDGLALQTGVYQPINNGIVNVSASQLIYTGSSTAFQVQNPSNTYPVLNVDTTAGTTLFRTTANDNVALAVQNADGSQVFSVKAGVNGNLSNWKVSTSNIANTAPKARARFQATTAVNGDTYGYVIGGTNADTLELNTVQYAKLTGTGTENWIAGNNNGLPQVKGHAVVSAKGFLYVIGGADTGNAALSTVYYNKVGSNGNPSNASWVTTSALNTARSKIQAVYYQNYIYVFGGASPNDSSAAINTVERAQVHADGTLGGWSTIGTLPKTLHSYAAAVNNGYIYIAGGQTSDAPAGKVSDVYFSQIANDGSLGGWTADDSLPQVLSNSSLVIHNGYLYVLGGSGANGLSTVYYGAITPGSGVDSWSTSTMTDENGTAKSRANAGAFVFNGIIYVLGGSSGGNGVSTYLYASAGGNSTMVSVAGGLSVSSDASFSGSLTVASTLDTESAFSVNNSSGGNLLNVDTLKSNVTINGVNSGELHNWLTTTSLSSGLAGHGAVAVNGYMYAISGGTSKKVYYSKIKTDGSLGSWTDNFTTGGVDLPDYKNFNISVTSNGYIYVIGGYDSGSGASPTNTIYYAKPNIDGSISAWRTASSTLVTATAAASATIANGYLYVAGGASSFSSGKPASPITAVQYAKLNPDGSLTAFSSGTALPYARMGGAATVANGYLYFDGGADSNGNAVPNTIPSAGASNSTSIYYAPLSTTNGSIGGWTSNSSNPDSKAYHTTFVLNGYIYLVGGTDTTYGGAGTTTVDYGKLEADGSVNQWLSTVDQLSDFVHGHATVVANGYVYVIGGYGPSSVVMYSTASRVQVGGSLDLVGLGSRTLSDAGGGGELTAGNTTIVGTLDVRNAVNFSQSLAVNGTFTTHDDVLLQSDKDSSNAFQIQNSAGTVLLGVDAAAGHVNVNADMLFDDANTINVNNISHTGNGQDFTIDAGNDVITFTAGGRSFIFPTTGPSSQTICTTGISCASGGGQAVLLGSGTAQTNNTADSSIFINNTSTGKHLQLQSSGTDVFVVDTNGNLTLGTPGSVGGQIVFSDGTSSYSITLKPRAGGITNNRTVSFPDASGEVCLTSGNCAGSGSGVTAATPGTTNRIAKFNAGQDIGDSNISDDGTTVKILGTSGLEVGTNAITGQVALKSSTYSAILQPGSLSSNTIYNLPTGTGSTQTICTNSGNCFGAGSGSTLQAAYDAGNTISTSNNRDISYTLTDTTTDASFVVNMQGTGNQIRFQDGGTDVFNVADGGVFTLKSTSNSSSAFVLQNNSNTALLTADASTMRLKLGTGTPTLTPTGTGNLYVTNSSEFAGLIQIGDSSNNATFDATNHQLRFAGNARNTRRISLNAEYPGAVLDADGANNNGTMTAGYDSSQRMNYYNWTTSQSTSQDYDIVLQVQIPSDFSAWASSNPLNYSVYGSTTTACSISALITDTSGTNQGTTSTCGTNYTDITPSSTSTWQTKQPTTLSSGTYAAGSTMIIRLHLSSPNGGTIRVGRIYLDYLSAF